MGERTSGNDPLTRFVLVWAWAETIQPLNTHVAMTTLPGVLLPVATIALILCPRNMLLLTTFLGLAIGRTWLQLPFVPNHILFMLLINITLLIAIVQEYIRKRNWKVDRVRIYEAFAPVARLQLCLLYFFAVLAKLNVDYFNAGTSSAVALFDGFRSIFFWIPDTTATDTVAIYGSLLFEVAIPVLLIFRRTRLAGIICAVVFHLILAIHPLWATSILTFTMTVFALLSLFVPSERWRCLDTSLERVWNYFKPDHWRPEMASVCKLWMILAYVITLTCVMATVYPRNTDHDFQKVVLLHTVAFVPHFISCVAIAGGVFLSVWTRRRQPSAPDFESATVSSRVVRVNVCLVMAILTFVNGCCPYVGLKTTTAFTMFSNLRTEAGLNNHLFLKPVSWFDFQVQAARIEASNDPLLKPYVENGDWITLFELRRICSRDPGCPPHRTYTLDFDVRNHMFSQPRVSTEMLYVRYQMNGCEYEECQNESGANNLYTPHPWYLSRLLAFRPILSPGQPAPCDH